MTTNTPETLRNKAFDAVQLALGDAYDCDREWSAWSWGTMTEDDFSPVDENPDRVAEIANAALDAVGFDAILEERDRLRQALTQYANPANWEMDAENVWRMWREPGSSTPEAYDGFHLARAALKEQTQ